MTNIIYNFRIHVLVANNEYLNLITFANLIGKPAYIVIIVLPSGAVTIASRSR